MSEYLVQFNNISKFFGKVIALKDVTMKLKKGEIMCLLGDNGAGKSTLIKTLASVLIKVDFPAPLSPKRHMISPFFNFIVTSFKAITFPKNLLILLNWTKYSDII